ncbi:hypothetical protein [Nocardioides sp. MH1]|uniref:hypothetical protein n=1 Tax=Nocardioides sp. MH1 TaxID=3242490 RepID=UPI00351FCD84
MKLLTRMAVGAFVAAALVAPASAVSATAAPRAAGKDWTKIEAVLNAKQQACKVPANDGTAWKIYNRLDARQADARRVRATLTATRNGEPTTRDWDSGWVHKGDVSGVGSFTMPRGATWALMMTEYGDQAGGGGELAVDDIGRC